MVDANVTQKIITVDLTDAEEQKVDFTLANAGVAVDVQLIQKTETEAKYLVTILDSADNA